MTDRWLLKSQMLLLRESLIMFKKVSVLALILAASGISCSAWADDVDLAKGEIEELKGDAEKGNKNEIVPDVEDSDEEAGSANDEKGSENKGKD
jgi:hypothetical protein